MLTRLHHQRRPDPQRRPVVRTDAAYARCVRGCPRRFVGCVRDARPPSTDWRMAPHTPEGGGDRVSSMRCPARVVVSGGSASARSCKTSTSSPPRQFGPTSRILMSDTSRGNANATPSPQRLQAGPRTHEVHGPGKATQSLRGRPGPRRSHSGSSGRVDVKVMAHVGDDLLVRRVVCVFHGDNL